MAIKTKNKRERILEKFDRCQICGCKDGGDLWFEIDHILPKSAFNFLKESELNLTVLCKRCNSKKGSFYGRDLDYKIIKVTRELEFWLAVRDMQNKLRELLEADDAI